MSVSVRPYPACWIIYVDNDHALHDALMREFPTIIALNPVMFSYNGMKTRGSSREFPTGTFVVMRRPGRDTDGQLMEWLRSLTPDTNGGLA